MTLHTGIFGTDIQKPILKEVFNTGWDGDTETYSKICKVEDSSDAFETDLQFQSPDEIAQSDEGGMYTRVEIENVRKKTFTHVLYKAEIKITREMLEDARYKQILDAVKFLGIAAKRTVERKAAAALYNGFTSELSPDGSPVFASHTLANPLAGRPTTFANNRTGKLNATNLKAMRINGRKTLDEHGSINPCKYDLLVVPPALEFTGKQLLVPDSRGEAGTANNDASVAGAGVQLIVNDWLSEAPTNADTAWFMLSKMDHRFKFYWRRRPTQELVDEEASGDKLYRVTMRFSVGWSDYRGAEGSTGTT